MEIYLLLHCSSPSPLLIAPVELAPDGSICSGPALLGLLLLLLGILG
jgi:hypothetical protein